MHGVHDVEHMVGKLPVGTMWAVILNSGRHVGGANSACILSIAVRQGQVAPRVGSHTFDSWNATKGVGVGHAQGALGPENLYARRIASPDVKAGCDCADGAAGKIHDTSHVCGHIDINFIAVLLRACNRSLWEGDARGAA